MYHLKLLKSLKRAGFDIETKSPTLKEIIKQAQNIKTIKAYECVLECIVYADQGTKFKNRKICNKLYKETQKRINEL